MRDRVLSGAVLLSGLLLLVPLTSCNTSPSLTSITVTPTTMNFGGAGLTTQLTATGSYTHPGHPAITKDITNQVTWASSTTDCVTVSATGLITSGGNVCSNILVTASSPGFNGTISGSMTVNVTQPAGGSGSTTVDVTSIAIIPSTQSVAAPPDTAQFIAIGTTSSGATVDLTNYAAWSSSSAQIATITAGGLATAVSKGTATITALFTNSADGTTATGTAQFVVLGGTTQQYTAITITPSSETLAEGGTGQFIALATSGATGLQENVTTSPKITWSASQTSIATIGANTGIAEGVSAGNTSIDALLTNSDGSVVSANPVTVTVTATPPAEPILSLSIIPSSITVLDFNLTGQFLAIGTYGTPPYVRDVTNSAATTWLSSEPEIFPVGTNSGGNSGASAGLVTAIGSGGATIIAESSSEDGTIQTATSTFSCPYQLPDPPTPGSCFPGQTPGQTLLETLTVYNEGLNATNWQVTAPSATGTADVIHCGPAWALGGGTGGSVCTGTYPLGSKVILTAPAGTVLGGFPAPAFGGWSYNCVPSDATGVALPGPVYWTAAGPNYCVVTLSTNDTVGAIFN